MPPPLRVGTVYDFRNTPESGLDMPSLYAAIMDQVVMLDGLGLDLVWFTEHHFLDDGYLPSWVPMAGAIAARTKHVRLSSDVCLLPFNHPVRLAEDLAVLDNISNGRIEVGVGMGYAPHEFRGFGLPVSRRVSLTDEGIEVLRHCFTGEKFSFHGKRYDFDDVVIRPRYVQPGGPPLWIAEMSEAGAQRAARNDSNFLPQGARSMVLDPWRATLKASGRNPDNYRVGIIRSCLVSSDLERDWPAVRAAERYRGQVYRSFNKDESAAGGVSGNTREASIPQTWVVGNVEHCVKELTSFVREYGITDLVTWAVPPGMRPEQMNGSLERFVRDVAPRVKAAAAAALEGRRMGVGIGLGCAEFPFSGAAAYWRWIDICEAGGVDSIWQTDRIVGRQPFLESMTTMAALAGRTRRMRFGMNVVSMAFRDPVLLAKQCATIDVLSDGRLLPAFGIGSPLAPEWQALGIDTRTRGRKTDECLEIIRRLWREESVDFSGAFYKLKGVSIAPKPVQPDLPMWIGGSPGGAPPPPPSPGAARPPGVDRRPHGGGDPAPRPDRPRLAAWRRSAGGGRSR